MNWDPEQVLQDFNHVAELAGVSRADELYWEQQTAPHKPPALPREFMGVYIFLFKGRVLKVGKANVRSKGRFSSHHYNPNSSGSNLARRLLRQSQEIEFSGLTEETIKEWMQANTDRVNYFVPEHLGSDLLNLLEAFLICRLKPEFEGYDSQKR